jgi:DNA-binding SARP family transcriptional activator
MSKDALEILLPMREKLKDGNEKTLKDREACLMMIHSLKKDDCGVLIDLIETRIDMKQFERAIILIKKLVAADPENINLLKRQAFVYKQMGDMANYIKTFRVIASIYAREGNIVYRNIYFHKILKHIPNDVEALTVLKMEDQLRENIDSKIENTDSKIKMVDN